jgi:DNA invertase Pin-like site-specific DNA recombinase
VLIKTFTEVESGRQADRPELRAAILLCRVHGATLLVAKLDRLSRNLHFLTGLMDSGLDFMCADNPHANKLTIHILAAMAQYEAERISARTKVALAAAKVRGVRLGGLRNNKPPNEKIRRLARERIKTGKDERAQMYKVIFDDIGSDSPSVIADELNRRGTPGPKGGRWHTETVLRYQRALKIRRWEMQVASTARRGR